MTQSRLTAGSLRKRRMRGYIGRAFRVPRTRTGRPTSHLQVVRHKHVANSTFADTIWESAFC
jgi:hypothetical protein